MARAFQDVGSEAEFAQSDLQELVNEEAEIEMRKAPEAHIQEFGYKLQDNLAKDPARDEHPGERRTQRLAHRVLSA